jgi:hypothetical protein
MQHQEAYLVEALQQLEYDIRELSCYQIPDETSESFPDKCARIEAESAMTQRPIPQHSEHKDSDEDEDIDELDEESKIADAKRYSALSCRALTDGIVQAYADQPDTPLHAYPKSFEKQVPISVLKALYYATSQDVNKLSRRFLIPRHIVLVMVTANEEYPHSADRWVFAKHVHSSVRKALFYSKDEIDQTVLCSYYGLDADMCAVTEIGKSEELYALLKGHKSSSNTHEKMKFTLKEICEADQCEKKYLEAQYAQLKAGIAARAKSGRIAQYERQILGDEPITSTYEAEEKDDKYYSHTEKIRVRYAKPAATSTAASSSEVWSSHSIDAAPDVNTHSHSKNSRENPFQTYSRPSCHTVTVEERPREAPPSPIATIDDLEGNFEDTLDIDEDPSYDKDMVDASTESEELYFYDSESSDDASATENTAKRISTTTAATRSTSTSSTAHASIAKSASKSESVGVSSKSEPSSGLSQECSALIDLTDDVEDDESDVQFVRRTASSSRSSHRPYAGTSLDHFFLSGKQHSRLDDEMDFADDIDANERTGTTVLRKLKKNNDNSFEARNNLHYLFTPKPNKFNPSNYFVEDEAAGKCCSSFSHLSTKHCLAFLDAGIVINVQHEVDEPAVMLLQNFKPVLKEHQVWISI